MYELNRNINLALEIYNELYKTQYLNWYGNDEIKDGFISLVDDIYNGEFEKIIEEFDYFLEDGDEKVEQIISRLVEKIRKFEKEEE